MLKMMEHGTAGDPMTGLKWTRTTTQKLSDELHKEGIDVSAKTAGRLLKTLNFSLRVNHKKLSSGSGPERNEQFEYIQKLRKKSERQGTPMISIDTKKKELIGLFKNPGATWRRQPRLVKDHDFRSEAEGIANPYGIYDLAANRGHIYVGTSYDTPAFAVASLVSWWRDEGRNRYPGAEKLLILADCGGSNTPTHRMWKYELQTRLCNPYGLTITVSHYPPGASKWNPIEHRLFSEVSKNWAGEPLDSFETMLKYIRTTKTCTGLKVRANLITKEFPKGLRVSDENFSTLNLAPHPTLPKWNYTISAQ